jgi:hypothetical protein
MSTAASSTSLSFRTLARLVLQSALPRPQKAVLHALLAHARPDLTVYHAQGQLVWECGYTRPIIKKALATLKAQAILRVRQEARQHYATEYAIDLNQLPSRAPYRVKAPFGEAVSGHGAASLAQQATALPAEEARLARQRATVLPPEGSTSPAQDETQLPADHAEGNSVTLSGQVVCPQVGQHEQEKTFGSRNGSERPEPHENLADNPPVTPTPRRPRHTTTRPRERPAPDDLPLTEALRQWAVETVPGLPFERERDKFLCYARAHGLTNTDWSEALKGWWLEAHARAIRRGDLLSPTARRPESGPESPPSYDPELHAQMKADIARLCGTMGHLMPGTSDHQGPRRRRAPSILMAKGLPLEHDPAYVAQIQARKAMLQAQAALLRAQESSLEAVGAVD